MLDEMARWIMVEPKNQHDQDDVSVSRVQRLSEWVRSMWSCHKRKELQPCFPSPQPSLSRMHRVFRRQEQAFTYADALAARLSPEDTARYKVLSFETNSTGSRSVGFAASSSSGLRTKATSARPTPRGADR